MLLVIFLLTFLGYGLSFENVTCIMTPMSFAQSLRDNDHCNFFYHNSNCSIVINKPCSSIVNPQESFYLVLDTCRICPYQAISEPSIIFFVFFMFLILLVVFLLSNIIGLRVSIHNTHTMISVPRMTTVMVIHNPEKIIELIVPVDIECTEKCSICLEDINEPSRFNKETYPYACHCSSVYCKGCLFKWLTISLKCPICRISVV